MLEVVSWFLIFFTTHILDCYVFGKLINKKSEKKLKIIIVCLLFALVDSVFRIYSDISKIIITNLITVLLLKIIYRETVSKTLLGTLFTYMGYAIAELFYGLVLYLILGESSTFVFENDIGMIISNIFIFIIYILLFNIKPIVNKVGNIIRWCDDKKYLNILSNCFLAIIVCATLMKPLSFNSINRDLFMMILAIIIGIVVFIVGFFKEKSNNNQLTDKYDKLLDYVKDYEIEVVEKSKAIHEHKNQLIVIDGMIKKSDKELKKYVSDKLEKVKKMDDNVWLEKLTNLPMGGIKGLIYFKLKQMLENHIAVYVNVDDRLKNKGNWTNVQNNLEDYTRILGVYLDNAIEASKESKDKQIIIEFINSEDNIEFILSNTYKGIINFEEIDRENFSTKGKNRGYGLALVKEIVEKNQLINQTREINGKFYVQKLYIKK